MDNPEVLIIGYVWPEPQSSAAGSRMMQLIELFHEQDWEVTFASPAAESEHMVDLESLDIRTENIEANNSEFDSFVDELQPAFVVFDRFVTEEQFGWRVAEQAPDAMHILDTEDLHFLRRARHQATKDEHPFKKEDLLAEDTAKREIASILRCDLSLIISEYEMDLLINYFDIDPDLLCYLPFMLEDISQQTVNEWPSFDEREHFITIGNFHHEPNWDAILYLKEDIWPLIRRHLPDAELHIYGAYVTQKATQLHNPGEGFHIKGRAQNAKEVVRQAKVCLAPLRFGAGLKGKLVEAMQCGTPNVTTDIGAEGLRGDMPWSGEIANNPQGISSAAMSLYEDKKRWEKAQKNGIRIINERFAEYDFGVTLIERVQEIRTNLETHRLKNFTGQMLMHHTMASTEYMSRWIEEKNN